MSGGFLRVALPVGLCGALLLAPGARAGKFQIGASIGKASLEAPASGARVDVDDTGYRISAAYRLFRFVAIEAGYTDLGDFDETTIDGTRYMAEADLINAYVVGLLPLNPRLELFGKVGAAKWDVQATVDDGSGAVPSDDDGTDLAYGVGVAYKFFERLSARVEWETTDAADNETKFFSAGLQFHF